MNCHRERAVILSIDRITVSCASDWENRESKQRDK